ERPRPRLGSPLVDACRLVALLHATDDLVTLDGADARVDRTQGVGEDLWEERELLPRRRPRRVQGIQRQLFRRKDVRTDCGCEGFARCVTVVALVVEDEDARWVAADVVGAGPNDLCE